MILSFVILVSRIVGIMEAKTVLPMITSGINECHNPIEKYWILYRLHTRAVNEGFKIDYTGIDSITIEIPQDAKPIPIHHGCNFKGLKLFVTNNQKNFELFIIKNQPNRVNITPDQIDNGDFHNIPELNSGIKLLAIVDSVPWINERVGLGYPHLRKDVISLRDGLTNDVPIQPYSDSISQPYGVYIDISNTKPIIISDIEIIRSPNSSFKTLCFHADYQYNIQFKNITIVTPESELYGDQAIRIRNSKNVSCRDIVIRGTYSQPDKWGYGIALDNVRNAEFLNLIADGNWGIFGNNNLTNIHIINSDINRFDVHCYGKDAYIKNTTFRNLRNCVSSFFGYICFYKCNFLNFLPLLIRDSYRINTKFNIYFDNCNIVWNKSECSIIATGKSISENFSRFRLNNVEWPNVFMNNTCIISNKPQASLVLFRSSSEDIVSIDSKLNIELNHLNLTGFKGFEIFNKKIDSKTPINIKVENINLVSAQ